MTLIRNAFSAMILLVGLGVMGPFGVVNAVSMREAGKDYLRKPMLAWDQKTIPFKAQGASWRNTLQWFAEEAVLDFVAISPPPQGMARFDLGANEELYSLAEIFDFINEHLQESTNHTLIRKNDKLVLIAADAPVHLWPPLPRVHVRDLHTRGRRELVEVDMKINDELIVGQVKKWLGVWGQVFPQENGNVVLRARVVDLVLTLDSW